MSTEKSGSNWNRLSLGPAPIAALLIGAQVVAKSVRDALFLSQHPPELLPQVVIAASLLSLVAAWASSRALGRFAPRQVVPVALALHGVLFAAESWLSGREPAVAAIVLYLHTGALAGVVISAFWSLVNEAHDPHSARRAVARLGTAATLGGVVGGVLALSLASTLSLAEMLTGLSVGNLLAALGCTRIATDEAPSEAPKERRTPGGGMQILRKSAYLRWLAALVVLVAAGEVGFDYVFKASAAARFTEPSELVAFFAAFNLGIGVLTVALQATVVFPLLRKFGLEVAAASLPATVLVAGGAALMLPGIVTASILRGGAQSMESSLYRSAYELFYTPLAPHQKRPTKPVIDVGADKLGAVFGGALALAAVSLAPSAAQVILLVVSLTAAVAALLVVSVLRSGYVNELSRSLRSGEIAVHQLDLSDATTRDTVTDTLSLDRRELLAQIELERGPVPHASIVTQIAEQDDLRDALSSGSELRIRAALSAGPNLEADLIPAVARLLGDDALSEQASAALRRAGSAAVAPLVSLLSSSDSSAPLRLRIPRVLVAVPEQSTVDGLTLALADPLFEVRYRSAAALMQVTAGRTDLLVQPESVLVALRSLTQSFESEAPVESVTDPASILEREHASSRLGRQLTYVFTLLSLILEREPLHLAFVGLGSDDDRVRGTAREYLDNVIPAELRNLLAPLLADKAVASGVRRPRRQVLEDLMASNDALAMDPEILRRLRDG